MPTPYIMIKTEVDVTEISYIHSICIVPLKKISAENPYDIREFGIF